MKNINNTFVFLGLALAFACFSASSVIVRADMELVTETATVAAVVEVSDAVAEDASQTEASEPATDVENDGPTDETVLTPDTSDVENAVTNGSTEDATAEDSEVMIDGPTCLAGESAASQLRAMGDIDGNGIINKIDLEILSAHYENSDSSEVFEEEADINGDGSVNFDDLLTLTQNYGKRLCVLPPNSVCEESLSADINNDGVVNMTDLEILSSQYNQTAEGLSGDINKDRSVNFSDLLILAQQYDKVVCDMNGEPTNGDDDEDEDDDNNNSSRRRSSSGRGGDNDGEVLGASTGACGLYLTGFVFPNQ
ncbi:MAG TPA: dockerin type I domain-containing protein, partial [Candidatus Paceibacterota bacterium]|nr:dockerin type I domain-containing protein [Candidatus Paceibacterota bacterium]